MVGLSQEDNRLGVEGKGSVRPRITQPPASGPRPPMKIEFTNPVALVLLGLIPVALYFARHSLANLARARARASLLARVVLLLMIVLALAGIRVRTASRDLALIFVVDVSASVALDAAGTQGDQSIIFDFINGEIARAAPRDYIGVIAFGREASVELAPTRKESLGAWRIKEINSDPPRDYTDIAGALRLAAALVPETAVGRIVLVSDGNENLESAAEQAQLLRSAGIEVYTRAIGTVNDPERTRGEIAVRDLVAPEMAAEGEAFDLKVIVDSTRDTDAVLRIFRNDSLVAERSVHLAAAGENLFLLPQRNDERGFYTYRAEIEALQSDGFKQNNSREAFSMVEGRPKTLYLYGDAQPSAAVARVLADGNFAADIRPGSAAPTTLAGFQNYDLVIFDNVPASDFTTDQMKMVQSYVKDLGGGFIMIGGDQSFGPGGYYETPIEETLPVSLDVRQKKHFPSLAMALVIDRSGSMAGPKLQLAVEAASATVDFLSERDSVGVIAFDDQPQPVVELTHVEDKKAIIKKITEIQVGGGTNMYPGLQTAYEWLVSSDAQIKHILVLSDGQSERGDFAGIARAVSEAGMTLSTVAIGDDADIRLMKLLADVGQGRFYATDRADNLPRIFTREAFLASRSTIIEEPFTPRLVRPTQATEGLDWNTAPQLNGYVGTAERDSATSPAITSLVSDKDDPVYAVWQYGLGRAAAFTSDAKGRWAAGWMNWPGFGQFWAQALRDTLRREGATDLTPRVEINQGRGHVTVEALSPDGSFKNNLRLGAHIVAPDFSSSDIKLEQTAAGLYEGEFAATARGAYLVSVVEENGRPAPVTGSVNSYSPEFSITSSDVSLLARVSEATGGSVISADASGLNLFERHAEKTRPHEIWESLILAALLLLPVDIGIRRLNITREQILNARYRIESKFRRATPEPLEAEAGASLAQLKDARARVRLGNSDTGQPDVKLTPVEKSASPALISVNRVSRDVLQGDVAQENKPPTDTAEAQPLASRLLDAKRKKRDL